MGGIHPLGHMHKWRYREDKLLSLHGCKTVWLASLKTECDGIRKWGIWEVNKAMGVEPS